MNHIRANNQREAGRGRLIEPLARAGVVRGEILGCGTTAGKGLRNRWRNSRGRGLGLIEFRTRMIGANYERKQRNNQATHSRCSRTPSGMTDKEIITCQFKLGRR